MINNYNHEEYVKKNAKSNPTTCRCSCECSCKKTDSHFPSVLLGALLTLSLIVVVWLAQMTYVLVKDDLNKIKFTETKPKQLNNPLYCIRSSRMEGLTRYVIAEQEVFGETFIKYNIRLHGTYSSVEPLDLFSPYIKEVCFD